MDRIFLRRLLKINHNVPGRLFILVLVVISLLPVKIIAADLGSGQAYVILGLEDKNRNIETLRFQEYLTGETFDVTAVFNQSTEELDVEPAVITGGNYYLAKIMTVSETVAPITFDKPEKVDATFKVFPGSVTYIGTWYFDDRVRSDINTRLKIKKGYPDETIVKLADKYPDLTRYPLVVATDEGKLFRHDWARAAKK